MRRISLDLDALRSFAMGIELGSFAKAAERLSRSTSAVSAQLKKLERQAGAPVLRRQGRGMALTETGETLLAYARRLLELNDEAVAALRGSELQGTIRLGMQEDFGETLLPEVLGRFARTHPQLRIEARIARNAELVSRIEQGRLDLALAWRLGAAAAHVERIGDVPLAWIGARDRRLAWRRGSGEPLPLVMLDAPCAMRTAAIDALDRAGIPWRIAFASASLAGIWAGVAAGLGLTLRTAIGLPERLRLLAPGEERLPRVRSLGLAIHLAEAEPTPAVERLAAIVKQDVRSMLLRLPAAPKRSAA